MKTKPIIHSQVANKKGGTKVHAWDPRKKDTISSSTEDTAFSDLFLFQALESFFVEPLVEQSATLKAKKKNKQKTGCYNLVISLKDNSQVEHET